MIARSLAFVSWTRCLVAVAFWGTLLGMASNCASSAVAADVPQQPAPQPAVHVVPTPLVWQHDYDEAMRIAKQQKKMLFVFFTGGPRSVESARFEAAVLGSEPIRQRLSQFVLARFPADYARATAPGEVPQKLLKHASFGNMQGQPGLAIIDQAHPGTQYYGHVVSAFPFTGRHRYDQYRTAVILDLPAGTITQRTMAFAVLTHPERPKSANSPASPYLASQAEKHSTYQANIQNQGHHNWDSRFQQINANLPGGMLAQEVVAESWGGENLVDACEECVHSWRQSSGHWSAVRERHGFFGYDIKRGGNGVWYATGIFARWR